MAKNRSQNSRKELDELESTYEKLSGKYAKPRHKYERRRSKASPVPWIIGICIATVVLLVGGFFLIQNARGNQVIASNLSIAGVNVTGMTRDEAETAVGKAFSQLYTATPMTVEVDGQTLLLTPDISDVRLDVSAAVNAAVGYHHASFHVQALDITDYISVDTEAIMAQLRQLSSHFDSTLTQSTYRIEGAAPESTNAIDETVAQSLVITKGRPGIRLDLNALLETVLEGYSGGAVTVSFHCPFTEPDALDLEEIYQAHCIAPVEAEFEKETFEVLGGTYGYGFSVEEAAESLEKADYGQEITIDYTWTEPETTAEELGSLLFRDELSSYTTHAGSIADRNTNLRLACEAINGMILYPGDLFSYNEALGERTPEKGYRPGASYIGGETVLDYGGGICQVTSTLFYCTVVADLEVVERECHGYASSYTPLSTDATVFWGGIDYKFRNNTDYPIRIEAHSDRGNVTVKLIGTDTKDYYVKFESEFLAQIDYETVYKEMEPDNKKGYKDGDVITDPYTGYKSRSYRVKYDKQTDEEIERILECNDVYSSRNKVICKIVGGETEPPTTEPPATEPPTTAPTTEPSTETPTEAPTAPPETVAEESGGESGEGE